MLKISITKYHKDMNAFLFDLVNKLQRTTNTLDAKAILCNKTWRVFSDAGEKEVYIFMEDGKLVISVNGSAVIGSWMYIPANQSLVISGNNQNFLVHPIICNNILVLALDGSNQCCFLLDSTRAELESIQSLKSIESYINNNANQIPLLPKAEGTGVRNVVIQKPVPADAIYASDRRLKKFEVAIWNAEHTRKPIRQRMYIKGLFSYKLFTGTIYSSRHNVEVECIDGRMWRMSWYHPNKQLAMIGVFQNDEDKGYEAYYDENGYELTEKAFNAKYGSYIDHIGDTEGAEFANIAEGGRKDA